MSEKYVVIVEWDDDKEHGVEAGYDGPYENLYFAQIDYPPTCGDGGEVRYVGKKVHRRGQDD